MVISFHWGVDMFAVNNKIFSFFPCGTGNEHKIKAQNTYKTQNQNNLRFNLIVH